MHPTTRDNIFHLQIFIGKPFKRSFSGNMKSKVLTYFIHYIQYWTLICTAEVYCASMAWSISPCMHGFNLPAHIKKIQASRFANLKQKGGGVTEEKGAVSGSVENSCHQDILSRLKLTCSHHFWPNIWSKWSLSHPQHHEIICKDREGGEVCGALPRALRQ